MAFILTIETCQSPWLLTGIGLNVDNEKPSTCLNAVLQELSSVPCKLRREEILAAFFKRFEIFFDVLLNQGAMYKLTMSPQKYKIGRAHV